LNVKGGEKTNRGGRGESIPDLRALLTGGREKKKGEKRGNIPYSGQRGGGSVFFSTKEEKKREKAKLMVYERRRGRRKKKEREGRKRVHSLPVPG